MIPSDTSQQPFDALIRTSRQAVCCGILMLIILTLLIGCENNPFENHAKNASSQNTSVQESSIDNAVTESVQASSQTGHITDDSHLASGADLDDLTTNDTARVNAQDPVSETETETETETTTNTNNASTSKDTATNNVEEININELDAEINALIEDVAANTVEGGVSDTDGVPHNNQATDQLNTNNDLADDMNAPNVPNIPGADPDQAIQGDQITKVEYKAKGKSSVQATFRTSVEGKLQATVTLPDGRSLTLYALEGQGNNPTYQSKDGNIELISHSGGSSMDLLINGETTEYHAVSAEAEVVTEM